MAGRAARSARARPASEVAREEVLAGEAADVIAANATPVDAGAIAEAIEGHVAAPDQEPGQPERDRHAEDVEVSRDFIVDILRRFIINCDEDERPFVRVVGRIVHILTVGGDREWCTVTPIAVALLLLLQEHLDPEHRQVGANRQAISVTEQNLQGLLYDRLKKLTSQSWDMARKKQTGRGYQLTEAGRFAFNGWPEEVAFDPRREDLWNRRRPGSRGGGRGPAPETQR
jgi:hypothetical protein